MATQEEAIDLCSSSEDENDAAPPPPVARRRRIPSEPSQPQAPTNAAKADRALSSLPLNNGTAAHLERKATTTTSGATKPEPNGQNLSKRRIQNKRTTSAQHNSYPASGRQSPTASELLREEVDRARLEVSVDDSEKKKAAKDSKSCEKLEREKISLLQEQCFACQVPLCHPVRRDVERSCYALHSHPTLKVPVCVVCSNEIANLELSKSEEDDEEEDVCGLCGSSSDESMFLCDEKECCSSRTSICHQCVQQANPTLDLKELEASNEEWSCPCCKPTRVIMELQQYLEELQELQQSPTGSKETRIDSLLAALNLVESKKAECEEAIDNQEDMKIEIDVELFRSGASLPQEELEDQAEAELGLWLDAQNKHLDRLENMIVILHEYLEQEEGFDVKEAYNLKDTTTGKEEDWKIQADKALAQRDEEQKQQRRQNPPERRRPTKEEKIAEEERALEEIDDLGSLSEASGVEKVYTYDWRHSAARAAHWEIEEAMELEDEAFAEARRKPRKVSEKRDTEATVTERKKSALVRKEAAIVVKEYQRNRRRTQNRRRSTDSSNRKSNASNSTNSSRQRISSDVVRTQALKKEAAPKKRIRPRVLEDYDSSEDENIVQQKRSTFGHLFENSDLILTTDPRQECIRVAEALSKTLKQHQKDGVKFMFQNSFRDLAFPKDKDTKEIQEQVGGCILAHNMGLGKSLCCVTLLHTLFFHPSLQNDHGQPKMRFVILVAPVNTIRNWENELSKWTKELGTLIDVHCLSSGGNHGRVIRSWAKIGGVLLMSDALFRSNSKEFKEELHNRCDFIILDEAHTMLKNRSNAVFKALMQVKSKRRICLTGSPFQNSLLEYFRMASYIRPGVLGHSEAAFEKKYVNPILDGLSTDATDELKKKSDEAMNEIQAILKPYIDRKDASVLLQELPPMQQVVLHLRPTKMQRSLDRAYKRFDDRDGKNFLHMYSNLRTVHNHPGTLLFRETKAKPKDAKEPDPKNALPSKPYDSTLGVANISSNLHNEPASKVDETPKILIKSEPVDNPPQKVAIAETEDADGNKIIELLSDSEEEEAEPKKEGGSDSEAMPEVWWSSVTKKHSMDEMKKIEHGNKVVLLLHILTHACQLNEKVVLFAQCLKTLDYISHVLSSEDWASQVPSLAEAFPGVSIGGWRAGKDFLRIDGATSASDRGNRVSQFEEDSMRLFLISSRAGGIGINLCSANRVVLFDSHFNPTVDLQALYRCYRYGQKRGVFAYRFLTEGTTEGKVYSRAVNKSSLALSLVDGKSFQRLFSAKETEDITKTDSWALCENCQKWRMFPPEANIDESTLPDKWYCKMMNEVDERSEISCESPEMDVGEYFEYYAISNEVEKKENKSDAIVAMSGAASSLSEEKKEELVARDEILKGLLKVSCGKKPKKVVSRHYFHDALIDQDKEKKARPESGDQSLQLIDQDTAVNGVEPSNRTGAKKAKVVAGKRNPQPTAQDTTFASSDQSDRKKRKAESPRRTNQEKAQAQQRAEVDSSRKRSPPRTSKDSSAPKRPKRPLIFKSLFSGPD